MRKCLVFHVFLMLALRALAVPTFATKNVPENRVGDDHEGEMVSITARGVFTGGDVTLSVTKTGTDSYSFYDSNRNIRVISGAELPPLDSLLMQGRFYDYFPYSDRYGDDVDAYISHIVHGIDDSEGRMDISDYLKLAPTVTCKGAPLCAMTSLPGGEVGVLTIDGDMPKYFLTTEQAGAYAKSEFDPVVVICGTGGRVADPIRPELEIVMLPMVEPSVMTHEFTHLVTKNTAQLSSNMASEGGALNESFSDIMAISMMKTARVD